MATRYNKTKKTWGNISLGDSPMLNGSNLMWSKTGSSVCSPILIDDWVFEVSFTWGGYTLTQWTTSGLYVRTIAPQQGLGTNENTWSWPYTTTSTLSTNWPSLFLDTKTTTSDNAVIWCEHNQSHIFKINMNRTNGATTIDKIGTTNGPGYHFRIVVAYQNDLYTNLGYPEGNWNQPHSTKVLKSEYDASLTNKYKNYVTKYCQNLNHINSDRGAREHNTDYLLVIGVNNKTGRVYIQSGGHGAIYVLQIKNCETDCGYQRFVENSLHDNHSQDPDATYGLEYVKTFIPPATEGYIRPNIQTFAYQVIFDPDLGEPIALSRGNYFDNHYGGGGKIWSWNPDWT